LSSSAHPPSPAPPPPRRDAHDSYVRLALGHDLAAMLAEIGSHMGRGAEQTENFLEQAHAATTQPPKGATT
jgi:hypothetical protein